MPTIVTFHAHPDDESSKGAATVARLVASGWRAVLVTATGGEAGDILNPAMDRPEITARLAEVRSEELDRAAEIIGYHRVVRLGYRDSGMPGSDDNANPAAFTNADLPEVLGRVVAIVREEQPDVFMGYDAHERYPHPDHLQVHQITRRVATASADPDLLREAADPWQLPLVVAPTWTRRRAEALHAAALRLGIASPLGRRLEGLGEDNPALLLRARVDGWVEQGRDALRAHATQVDPSGQWFSIPTAVVEDVYPYEDFEVLAAAADGRGGDDVFEAWDRPHSA